MEQNTNHERLWQGFSIWKKSPFCFPSEDYITLGHDPVTWPIQSDHESPSQSRVPREDRKFGPSSRRFIVTGSSTTTPTEFNCFPLLFPAKCLFQSSISLYYYERAPSTSLQYHSQDCLHILESLCLCNNATQAKAATLLAYLIVVTLDMKPKSGEFLHFVPTFAGRSLLLWLATHGRYYS